ncbi:hypothetical protein PInf_015264 [Phytophthora infestans]|nr:hypothetical protein PInf_015264 [Phytophthora infestans]
MPGKTKKDVRGVDIFVGEAALMVYLDGIALDDPNIIAPGDNPADFAALDSDGGNANMSI